MRRPPEGNAVSRSDSSKEEAGDGAAAPPPRKLHNLAYGIERLGLIPLRAPVVSAVILTVLCVIAALGIERLKVYESQSQLFRSDNKEIRQYEQVTQQFPSRTYDVLEEGAGKHSIKRDANEHTRDHR